MQAQIGVFNLDAANRAAALTMRSWIDQKLLDPTKSEQMAAATTYWSKSIEQLAQTAKVAAAPLEQLQHLQNMAGDLRGQLDSTSVASLNAISDSLVDMTTGAKSAGDAFKDMANSIVRAIERMIIQMTIIKPLAAGLQSVLGGFAGGGGISIPGFNPISGVAGVHHGGYGPGDHFTTRAVNDNVFAFAPRFHTGIGPGERAAVIRDDESVLTPGQMRALAPAGRGDVNVTINGAPSTPTVTQRQNSNGGRDITIDFANAVTGVLTADAAKNGPIAKAFASRAAGFRGS